VDINEVVQLRGRRGVPGLSLRSRDDARRAAGW